MRSLVHDLAGQFVLNENVNVDGRRSSQQGSTVTASFLCPAVYSSYSFGAQGLPLSGMDNEMSSNGAASPSGGCDRCRCMYKQFALARREIGEGERPLISFVQRSRLPYSFSQVLT